jgi:hypothetical protein
LWLLQVEFKKRAWERREYRIIAARGTRAMNVSHHNNDSDGMRRIRATARELKAQIVGLDWRRLAFFLGVPLALAVYPAINNLHLLETAGHWLAVSFYLAHALPPWWITCVATQTTMIVLSPLRPPPLVLMIIGTTAAGFLVIPYLQWIYAVLPATISFPNHSMQWSPLSSEFWVYMLRAGVVWIGVNVFFDRVIGLPRYRYKVAESVTAQAEQEATIDTTDAPPKVPRFLDRSQQSVGLDQLIAFKAEEHYIRVFTDEQKFQIYYRFTDAIDQTDPRIGLQVHRSYWVNKAAIREVRKLAKKMCLEMSNGLIVPVSRPYQALVMDTAGSLNIPIGSMEKHAA